jgi:glutamate 5-kinase
MNLAAKSTVASPLASAKRIVIKTGSALIVDEAAGKVRQSWLDGLGDDIARLRQQGAEVIVVSSGAIAVGRTYLKLPKGPLALEEKQAAAATGQIRLAHAWQENLARHHITVAQVLLTLDDSEDRRRYLNASSTLRTLLRLGAVPVINENDTVATAEIRFGDNDRLAARVAQMISADTLILLSDIDGLYTADPRSDKNAQHLPLIEELTPEIEAMAGAAPEGFSSGGMITKLIAARIAMGAGCRMAIADGKRERPISALLDGASRSTWFVPRATPRNARKRWIAGSLSPSGVLVVDDGAARALAAGKSLLPAGIAEVEGSFERGDLVVVRSKAGKVLGRGLVAYSAEDARRIKGHKSGEIETRLGYRGRDEMIHRDDLVVE